MRLLFKEGQSLFQATQGDPLWPARRVLNSLALELFACLSNLKPACQSPIRNPIPSLISSSAPALPLASSTVLCVWRVFLRCLKLREVSRTRPL